MLNLSIDWCAVFLCQLFVWLLSLQNSVIRAYYAFILIALLLLLLLNFVWKLTIVVALTFTQTSIVPVLMPRHYFKDAHVNNQTRRRRRYYQWSTMTMACCPHTLLFFVSDKQWLVTTSGSWKRVVSQSHHGTRKIKFPRMQHWGIFSTILPGNEGLNGQHLNIKQTANNVFNIHIPVSSANTCVNPADKSLSINIHHIHSLIKALFFQFLIHEKSDKVHLHLRALSQYKVKKLR
jgi:hypothetical protein